MPDDALSKIGSRVAGAGAVLPALLQRVEAAVAACTAAGPLGGGVLLHGPAGCGKTLLARALDETLRLRCVWIDPCTAPPGDGTQSVLHARLEAARAAAPCVLVIDELQALAPALPAGSSELRLALQLAHGVEELRAAGVIAIGLCRSVGAVHASVRRAGRLDCQLCMRAPDPREVRGRPPAAPATDHLG
jgi:SpoVK/Ycf46/Vps4 family AAA+-type ATPase